MFVRHVKNLVIFRVISCLGGLRMIMKYCQKIRFYQISNNTPMPTCNFEKKNQHCHVI